MPYSLFPAIVLHFVGAPRSLQHKGIPMDPWMQLSLAAVLMFLLGVLVFYPLRGPKTRSLQVRDTRGLLHRDAKRNIVNHRATPASLPI